MIFVSKAYQDGKPFWFRENPEHAVPESLVLRAHDGQQFRAVCWTSTKHPKPKVAVVLMHPILDFTHHYAIPRLLDGGFCVLGILGRDGGNGLHLEQESLLLDIAAGIRFLKVKRDIRHIALFGNDSGGALLAYYQSEARVAQASRTKVSPASSPTHFDRAQMTPADLMVYVAVDRGLGKVLMDGIDPSVSDERDPFSLDPTLDLYDERNGFREPPGPSRYPRDFIRRYRTGQLERVHRLDQLALELVDIQRTAEKEMGSAPFPQRLFIQRRDITRRSMTESVFTIYRTMANPNCVDMLIEPSKRDYGSLLSDRPDFMNYAAAGPARVCTPRAWLSTWSGLSSNADLCANVERIREPSLFVYAMRDREVLPSDARAIYNSMSSKDKTFHELDARHYFEPEPGTDGPGDVDKMMDLVIPWIHERAS